jgi:ubiquinone/menaquinone biosynthesis C-methylase UbiE
MPAHLVAIAAAQWFVFFVFFCPSAAVAGSIVALALLAVSTRTAGSVLWGPFLRRGPGAGVALAVTTDTPDLVAFAGAVARGGVPCSVFLSPAQAHDDDAVQALLAAGCDIGLRLGAYPGLGLGRRSFLRSHLLPGIAALDRSGVRPRLFLAPRGRSGPSLWPTLVELGLIGLRPTTELDMGETSGLRVVNGTIVSLHVPAQTESADLAASLDGAATMGLVPMASVLRFPTLSRSGVEQTHAVETFYDAIAESYDDEQDAGSQTSLRTIERRLVHDNLLEALSGHERVLELGAGTGRFSLAIARRVRRIVALDVSREMLRVLQRKAETTGLASLRTVHGDVTGPWPAGPFDVVCAMSAVEYVNDLAVLVGHAAEHLSDGGKLYFTTAHRTPFRWFTQLGNAMRQGIWLHGRSVGEVRRMLAGAGFEEIRTDTHGFRLPMLGGMLLEVSARKRMTKGA